MVTAVRRVGEYLTIVMHVFVRGDQQPQISDNALTIYGSLIKDFPHNDLGTHKAGTAEDYDRFQPGSATTG